MNNLNTENEYEMYIHSTEVNDFNGNHVGSISYDNWDGDENGFYTVRYWNEEVCHREYAKKKHQKTSIKGQIMTITNKERCEVAVGIRNDDVFWSVLKKDIDTYRGYLADLIEPEPERTCRIVEDSRKYVLSDGTELFEGGCSECGGYLEDGDNYCPNCGARVTN